MKRKVFIKNSIYDAPLPSLFSWHSRKGALERLLPPWSRIEVLSENGGIKNGGKKLLKMRAGPFKYKWLAHHLDYVKNSSFRDTQAKGFFAFFAYWSHFHKFDRLGKNSSLLKDKIEYKISFLEPANFLLDKFLQKELKRIFNYRETILKRDMKAHLSVKDSKKLTVLISGASGVIGSALIPFLTAAGHRVIKLVRKAPKNFDEIYWNPEKRKADIKNLEKIDAVIHLAGENIGKGKWTDKKKEKIIKSRVSGTNLILYIIKKMKKPPKVFLSASAIGFYGDRGGEFLDENAKSGNLFISKVCRKWEKEAIKLSIPETRMVVLRFGIVLTLAGGALKEFFLPFKMGCGVKIGDGKQYMSWVGIEDAIHSIHHILHDKSLKGAINITSPNPATNFFFTKSLSKALLRPAFFTLPKSIIKLIFSQKGEETLLSSARVIPKKLIKSGYKFIHPNLDEFFKEHFGKI